MWSVFLVAAAVATTSSRRRLWSERFSKSRSVIVLFLRFYTVIVLFLRFVPDDFHISFHQYPWYCYLHLGCYQGVIGMHHTIGVAQPQLTTAGAPADG